MGKDNSKQDRRSTRLSISIPVVISGVAAAGNGFSESVRTLIVNKHGGKITTTRHLAMGTEVLIENRALGAVAKASVAWLGGKHYHGDLHHVGLQLMEAQNVWGVVFPPDDWSLETQEEAPPAPDGAPASERADAVGAETRVSSLAGEEITIRVLQELQESADAHVQEFQDRLKQLTQRLGLELELDLRERAAQANAGEISTLEGEIKGLREGLSASCERIGKLEARMQELQGGQQAATEIPSPPPVPLQEARRQLTALTNSVVESMNRAAAAGLDEYRSLAERESEKCGGAARGRIPATRRPDARSLTPVIRNASANFASGWRKGARPALATQDESERIRFLHMTLPKGIILNITLAKIGLFLHPYFIIISSQTALQDILHE